MKSDDLKSEKCQALDVELTRTIENLRNLNQVLIGKCSTLRIEKEQLIFDHQVSESTMSAEIEKYKSDQLHYEYVIKSNEEKFISVIGINEENRKLKNEITSLRLEKQDLINNQQLIQSRIDETHKKNESKDYEIANLKKEMEILTINNEKEKHQLKTRISELEEISNRLESPFPLITNGNECEIEIISRCSIVLQTEFEPNLWRGLFNQKPVTIQVFSYAEQAQALHQLNLLLQLNQENVIKLLHHGYSNGKIYLIMEPMAISLKSYIDGYLSIIKGNDPIKFTNECKLIIKQLLGVLSYLHNIGYVINDIRCRDILMNENMDFSYIKLYKLDSCRESHCEQDKLKDITKLGNICYTVITGFILNNIWDVNQEINFVPFLDWASAQDAIRRMLRGEKGKNVQYYQNHPFIFSDVQILRFIDLAKDEIMTNFKGHTKRFCAFLDLRGGKNWIEMLDEDVQQAIHKNNKRKSDDPASKIKIYSGNYVLEIYIFIRNTDEHPDLMICGSDYPRSDVQRIVRPFPHLLPVAYNAFYDLRDSVKCKRLQLEFNLKSEVVITSRDL